MSKLTRLQIEEMNKQSSKSCGCETLDDNIKELELRIEALEVELTKINEKLTSIGKSKVGKSATKQQIEPTE